MFCLGKKLSSVLLCGSMAVTLLGNSGVHAADEIAEALGNESENASSNERDEKVESSGSGGLSGGVAKGLSTAALGVGMGIGADEGVRRFKRDSSGNEAGGQAPIVSKDGTRIEVLERQVGELQKKLEEGKKIYFDNLAYGSALGKIGEISKLRDIVSSKLGRDFDVKSKAAITGMIISYTIGLALFLWNLAKVLHKETRPNGKIGWTYTTVKMLTDVALPPLGLILQCGESIVDIFKSVFINNKNSNKKKGKSSNKNKSLNKNIDFKRYGKKSNIHGYNTGYYSNFYNVDIPDKNKEVNENNFVSNVNNNNIDKKKVKVVDKVVLDKKEDVENVSKYLKSLDSAKDVITKLKASNVFVDNSLEGILFKDDIWLSEKEKNITEDAFFASINKLSLDKIKSILTALGFNVSSLNNLKKKSSERTIVNDGDNNNIFSNYNNSSQGDRSKLINESFEDLSEENEDVKIVRNYLESLGSGNDILAELKKSGAFDEYSLNKLILKSDWKNNNNDSSVKVESSKIEQKTFSESIGKLSLEEIIQVLSIIGCFDTNSLDKLRKKDANVEVVKEYLRSLRTIPDIVGALEHSGLFKGKTVGKIAQNTDWKWKKMEEKCKYSIDDFKSSIKYLNINRIKEILEEIDCFVTSDLDNLQFDFEGENSNDINNYNYNDNNLINNNLINYNYNGNNLINNNGNNVIYFI